VAFTCRAAVASRPTAPYRARESSAALSPETVTECGCQSVPCQAAPAVARSRRRATVDRRGAAASAVRPRSTVVRLWYRMGRWDPGRPAGVRGPTGAGRRLLHWYAIVNYAYIVLLSLINYYRYVISKVDQPLALNKRDICDLRYELLYNAAVSVIIASLAAVDALRRIGAASERRLVRTTTRLL